MRIDRDDVAALELGVTLLGSGGGGDTAWAGAVLRGRIDAGRRPTAIPPGDLPPDALVVPVGLVGATAVLAEKPMGGHEFRTAVDAIARWTGDRPDAVMSIEVGGLNGLLPVVAADDLDLPYVDADLAGRGLPRLDQLSTAAAGRGVAPAALAAPGGQVLVLATGTPADVERAVRGFLTVVGGWAVLALSPVRVADLPGCAVVGSTSGALELGRRAVTGVPGDVLATGRVVDVSRRRGTGFGRGSVAVLDHATGAVLRLEMENEYLLALRDGAPVAATPDVLVVLERRTRAPISCYHVRPGIELVVARLPAPAFWADPAHLPVVAPRAFGIDCDPVPA
ncbi:DUF917 domain-containing protein [Saccharothrix obliqua]|uniref:DUF917 domain-containing protein n=1 Tax=Saccharothrix obliqua TaxID=2861747 RepID=UPI001C5DD23E|nr:DUF917 domain-containing protein [Saccharothrix obliqua]MBW4718500.1 DUF917 domain-containing protein [Saccharothrix obliqua]